MYQQFYDLLVTYIFDGAALDSFQQLVCTEISTLACLTLVAAPVVFFWRLIFR